MFMQSDRLSSRMYDRILVATDGSEPADVAVSHALDLAEQHDSEVHAIYVVETRRTSEPALSSAELKTAEMEEWGHSLTDAVQERGAERGVEVVTRCCHGRVSDEVVRYADDVDADLIVLAARGHSHQDSKHLGSVPDRIVRSSDKPTLII